MPRTTVGLDIGSSAVRAVEVTRSRGGQRKVRHRGSVPLPRGAVEGGVVQDTATVAAALRRLWNEHKFSSRDVRIGVGSRSVLARQLELDWMSNQDLKKSLRYQVAELLPVAVDEANLDHVYLGERTEPGQAVGEPDRRIAKVLLVATARDTVDELTRCCHLAKLKPLTADLGALALIRLAAESSAGAVTEVVIDVGVDKLTVAFYTGTVPHFVRVIYGFGSGMVTRLLTEQTHMEWDAAEEMKSKIALALPGTAPTYLEQQIAGDAVRAMLAEVRGTIDFHVTSDPDHVPTSVAVTGRMAIMPGFIEHAAAALDLPIRVLTGAGEDIDDLEYAVATGLCVVND